MSLSARQLRYLIETARTGSMHSAAKSLSISQSSIIAALDKAEAALDARIFERHPARGVTATPAGERFLIAARSMVSAHDAFERELDAFSSKPPKSLRIGCFEPFGSLFITEVLRRYVDAIGPVHVSLLEGDLDQLEAWLAAGHVDVVVAHAMGPTFAAASPIVRIPTHAVLHVDDPLAHQPVVSLNELARKPFVLLDLPHSATFLTTLFDVFASTPQIAFRCRSYDTVRSAVAAGFGFSLLNMRPLMTFATDAHVIVRRPISDELPPATLVVADNYADLRPWFVTAFIDELRRYFVDIGPQGFAVCAPERWKGLIAATDSS